MAVHKKYNHNSKTNALGRGLDALISTEAVSTSGSSTINEIAIDQIEPNPNQPRREFDQTALQELADSISAIGIIQPITLRQVDDNRFQIIAGERRWRASQLAGLQAIPAYIRTIKDENIMEMALVENIQREDLNAIEIAADAEDNRTEEIHQKVLHRIDDSDVKISAVYHIALSVRRLDHRPGNVPDHKGLLTVRRIKCHRTDRLHNKIFLHVQEEKLITEKLKKFPQNADRHREAEGDNRQIERRKIQPAAVPVQ